MTHAAWSCLVYAEPLESPEVGLLITGWNVAAAEHLANTATSRAENSGWPLPYPTEQPGTAVVYK